MTITLTSTKGGVGKTTLAANLGALLADMRLRVLLIDADVQPSLSKYFPLTAAAPSAGLTELMVRGEVLPQCTTPTLYQNLDIVVSDDPEGHLCSWLMNRIDRGVRMRHALRGSGMADAYDYVLIDTQGALGPLQDAAVLAADLLLSPVTPEILSAREFSDGTMEMLNRLEPGGALGARLAPMKVVVYRKDRTLDARAIGDDLRENLFRVRQHASVLHTIVPHAKAYKEAATLRVPVHRHERKRRGVMPSACAVMHQLAWELLPQLRGTYAAAAPRR